MSNNNHNSHLPCAFADRLVAVLYDEAGESEKRGLERHLPECRNCREEITAFAAMRNSIGEWRETAFLPLELPIFVLPQTQKVLLPTEENNTWFERLHKFFTAPNLRLQGAAAFAVLLISAALVFIFNVGSQSDDKSVVQTTPKVEQASNEKPMSPVLSSPQSDEKIINSNQQPSATTEKTVVQLNPKTKSAKVKAAANKDSETKSIDADQKQRRSPVVPDKKPTVETDDFDELLPTETEEDLPSLTDLLNEVTPAA
jgi:hypothetical protein